MSNKKDLLMPTIVLTVICLVASFLLAFTNQITAPMIEKAKADEANAARVAVLPKGDTFKAVTGYTTENVVDVYEAANGAGYAITAKATGYGGDLQVMTGITSDGKIAGTQVLVCDETPGLGARVKEEPYRSQYNGKDSALDGVDAISGSTISSTAFKTCVQTAFKAYGEVSGNTAAAGEQADPRTTLFPGVELTAIQLEGAKEAYRAGSQGYLIVTTAIGYHKTEMEVITAIGPDGSIVGVGLGANSETPGLGSRVGESTYTSQYSGKTADTLSQVDAVTGSTVSSDAFKGAVKQALGLVTPDMLAELGVEESK